MRGFISGVSICSIHLCGFVPASCSFVFCSFVVWSEPRKYDICSLVIFSQIALGIQGLLWFIHSISVKNILEILIGIALSLCIALGSMDTVTIFFQSKSLGYISISSYHFQFFKKSVFCFSEHRSFQVEICSPCIGSLLYLLFHILWLFYLLY